MSDRMVTAGDVQFSPQRSKIIWLTSSVVAMIAGHIALASELLDEVEVVVRARITAEPENWWRVADIAGCWRAIYLDRLRREAERTVLTPLGLTSETFLSRQKQLSSSLANRLAAELLQYRLPVIEVIFAGVDSAGPHIYVAKGAEILCQDAIGFAATGSGAYHANSHLMFSGHTATAPLHKALYRAYIAKKRAEVAPGVGSDTDTFFIWGLGRGSDIRADLITTVHEAYEEELVQTANIAQQVEGRVDGAIQDIIAPRPAQQLPAQNETPPDGEPPPAADGNV
ncbi:MAG: hypothetical protein JNN30_18250 [Rhodanobacteraceae bacterium]|nr:hypothetical protein [Rhodanobacteraceae bacterium]